MTRAGSPAAALTPDPGWTLGLLLELTISKLVQLISFSAARGSLQLTPDVLQQIPCNGQRCHGGTAMLRPVRGLKKGLMQRKGNPALPETLLENLI